MSLLNESLLLSLPQELKWYILTFDRRFVIRHGELITINRLDLTNHKNILRKPPICLEEYCDSSLKESVVYFSNPSYRLFYNVPCEKIVFETTREKKTIWYIYYLQ
jgi:hypothetical protein